MQLGLLGNSSVRVKEMGYIVQLTVPAQHMRTTDDMYVVLLCKTGEHLPVLLRKLRQIFNAQGIPLTVSDGHQLSRKELRKQNKVRTEFLRRLDVMLTTGGKRLK
ncbi:hypothetical protein D3C76_1389760 [compost metagenome]